MFPPENMGLNPENPFASAGFTSRFEVTGNPTQIPQMTKPGGGFCSKPIHNFFESVAALNKIPEHVEAGATRRKQYHISCFRLVHSASNSVFHISGVFITE
jgi:hypothetical protein